MPLTELSLLTAAVGKPPTVLMWLLKDNTVALRFTRTLSLASTLTLTLTLIPHPNP